MINKILQSKIYFLLLIVYCSLFATPVFAQDEILNSLPDSTKQNYLKIINNSDISYEFPKFEIQTDSLTLNRILENLDIASVLWRVYRLKPRYDITATDYGKFYLEDHRTIRGTLELEYCNRYKMGLLFSGKMNSSKPIIKNITIDGDGILLANFEYVTKNGKSFVVVECYAYAKIYNSFVSVLASVFNSAIKKFAIKRMDTLINRSKVIFTELYQNPNFVAKKLKFSRYKTDENWEKLLRIFLSPKEEAIETQPLTD
ncbi:MAG: hypothetical protein DWQ06_07070 [Calditrichaeota bacterium]|nr:MAG: hypothetical protein DWQ06_07070 [Calditrichota bacterium]